MKIFGTATARTRRFAAVGACAVAAAGIGVIIPSTAAAASVPRCRQGLDLRIGVGSADGTAGSVYRHITFKNISGHTCYLDGHPGVSYVGNDGAQVGDSATRTGTAHLILLKSGHTAYATLRIVDHGNYPNCDKAHADGLRVYPPGSTGASYVPLPGTTCSNQHILSVGTVHPS